MKKNITVVTPTFNEKENIIPLYERLCLIFEDNKKYNFSLLIIDNASNDGTVELLKNIAKLDVRVKVILNTRNFGHIRSPYWGILNAEGDATIYMASDLQDPPELINEFLQEWEKGWLVVYGVKPVSNENILMNLCRKIYYRIMGKLCDYPIIHNATGFGLYDKLIISHLWSINDPYPYLRGLVSELGYPIKTIEFIQQIRENGKSKNNLFKLYEFAIFSMVSQSTILVRIISLVGFIAALISLITLGIYLVLKVSYWENYPTGFIPAICMISLMFSILLTIIGIFGEYLLTILAYVRKKPIVIEKERINF